MYSCEPSCSNCLIFSARNLKPVKVSKHATPFFSAAARAISVVTMLLSTAGCAGMVFVSFFAVMM